MMQPCRDEQPFQKAVQKQPDIAGSGNEASDGRNGLLDRRPDKAGPKAQHRRQCRHAGKGPPHTGEHTAQNAAVGFFAGAVIHKGGEQAQQNAAEHAGIDHAFFHGVLHVLQTGQHRLTDIVAVQRCLEIIFECVIRLGGPQAHPAAPAGPTRSALHCPLSDRQDSSSGR